VTINLEGTRGACDTLFGSFPADASFGSALEPGRALTCELPRRGRYSVSVEANRPVRYKLRLEAEDDAAILEDVARDFPAAEGETSC
jgi:hypothetical protein